MTRPPSKDVTPEKSEKHTDSLAEYETLKTALTLPLQGLTRQVIVHLKENPAWIEGPIRQEYMDMVKYGLQSHAEGYLRYKLGLDVVPGDAKVESIPGILALEEANILLLKQCYLMLHAIDAIEGEPEAKEWATDLIRSTLPHTVDTVMANYQQTKKR